MKKLAAVAALSTSMFGLSVGQSFADYTLNILHINDWHSRIESNNIIGNDFGIQVSATGNIIIRNTASGNSVMNYNSVAGNIWGAVTAPATTPAFNANTGVGGTGTTDPNANFSY